MKLLKFLSFASVLLISPISHARIGESSDLIHRRYGVPFAETNFNGFNLQMFSFAGRTVGVCFLDGKSAAEIIKQSEEKQHFSDDESLQLAISITGLQLWKKSLDDDPFNTGWLSMPLDPSNQFACLLKKNILDQDTIYICGPAFLKCARSAGQKDLASIANLFGGDVQTNSAPTLSPEQIKAAKKAASDKAALTASNVLAFQKEQASNGSPHYQYVLGLRYASGDGVAADPQKARALFAASAAQGNTDASAALKKMSETASMPTNPP